MATPGPETDGAKPLSAAHFEGGWQPVAGFLIANAVVLVLVNGGRVAVFGAENQLVIDFSVTVFGTALTGLIAWFALRTEGVGLIETGLSRRLVLPALGAVVVLWTGLNIFGLGLAVFTGHDASIGFLYDRSAPVVAIVAIEQYLVVGLIEELAYRGYLQNKLVYTFGGHNDKAAVALGIGLMAIVFAATHLPNLLFIDGVELGALPARLGQLAVAAVLYGVIYETTGNLLFVGLLHGTFNQWLLFVDPRLWPAPIVIAWVVIGIALLTAVIWGHRRARPGSVKELNRGAI